MYYGNSLASIGENASGVWKPAYKMVHHFSENTTDQTDSTNYNNNGISTGAAYLDSGEINGARSFDGTDDRISVSDDSSLNFADNITISAWINTTQTTGEMKIVEKMNSNEDHGFGLMLTDGLLEFYGRTGTASYQYVRGSTDLATGGWHYVVGQRFGSNWKVFVNGDLENSVTQDTGGFTNFTDLFIGSSTDTNTNYFSGYIDEVRVSSAAHSPAWINANYLNHRNQFVSIGAEETP